MKYCPACNFSFPDFHHVCDFDGTELVTEPERHELAKARPSRLGSALKSPAFLSVLLAIALLSSAIMIGYLETRSVHVATSQPAVTAADLAPAVNGEEQPSRVRRRLSRSFHNHKRSLNRPSTLALAKRHQRFVPGATVKAEAARTVQPQQRAASSTMNTAVAASSNQAPARTSASRNPEFGASRNLQPAAHHKDPKLTAMLKTTWHVLKKPFKF